VSRDNAGDNDAAIRELSTAKVLQPDLLSFVRRVAGVRSTGFAST